MGIESEFVQELGEDSVVIETTRSREISASFSSPVALDWPCST